MIEIHPNLFIGNREDISIHDFSGFDLFLCAKTYHQKVVGYVGNLDKSHRQYLISDTSHNTEMDSEYTAYNLIDAPDVKYIPKQIIGAVLDDVEISLIRKRKALIACDQGCSRSACIGLMFLLEKGYFKGYNSFLEVEEAYKEVYPFYSPNKGMRTYTENFWKENKENFERNDSLWEENTEVEV